LLRFLRPPGLHQVVENREVPRAPDAADVRDWWQKKAEGCTCQIRIGAAGKGESFE
jgi:hypothetical protein